MKTSSNKLTQRNYSVDFLKLLFMIIIVLHHSEFLSDYLKLGYVAVEFFFFISGYFISATFEKGISLLEFIKRRIKTLYPGYISALALISVALLVLGEYSYKTWYGPFLELLMLQNVGIPNSGEGLNYPLWYVSVLFWGGILLYFLKSVLKNKCFFLVSGLIVILTYGYLIFYARCIDSWDTFLGVFYIPFWRGVADLIIGIYIYYLPKPPVIFGKMLQIISFFATLLLFFSPWKLPFLSLMLPTLLAYSIMNNDTVFDRISKTRILKKCYPYQYYIFLNHALGIRICHFISSHIDLPIFIKILLVLIIVAFLAFIMKKLTDTIVHFIEKMFIRKHKCF